MNKGKLLLMALVLVTGAYATNARGESYVYQSKQVSKLDAIKALLRDPNATVTRCNEVTLTEKATLKNKPKAK